MPVTKAHISYSIFKGILIHLHYNSFIMICQEDIRKKQRFPNFYF